MDCLSTISTHPYESMTVDEYAEFEKATTDDHIIQKDGFWWRQVRKGFYRPLSPFIPINENFLRGSKPFGVVQYSIINSEQGNSYMNLIMFDHLDEYELSNLPGEIRRNIRRAQEKNMIVGRISDPEVLKEQGLSVYHSFIKRTGYVYDSKRLDPGYFRMWIDSLFSFPKVQIHGVFKGKSLVSFMIETLVQDVLIIKAMINTPEALKLHAPDLQLHCARLRAKENGQIRTIYNGYYLQIPGLNKFKIRRGASVWCVPSRIEAPPSLLKMIKILKPNQYQHLMGFSEKALAQ